MQHALYLAPFTELADPTTIVELGQLAEARGWQGVFLWDHIMRDQEVTQVVGDVWVCLSAMAATTTRIRLGPMVTPLSRRRPAVLARQTVALDLLSKGRFTFGIGLGVDSGGELTRFGEVVDPKVRAEMLDEAIDVIERAWSGEEVNHRGAHYVVDGVRFLPMPLQRPRIPIWCAARGAARSPIRRAARFEGIYAIEKDADQLAEMCSIITSIRGSLEDFDIALNVEPPGTSVDEVRAAGATWAMHRFGPNASLNDIIRVTEAGPP